MDLFYSYKDITTTTKTDHTSIVKLMRLAEKVMERIP